MFLKGFRLDASINIRNGGGINVLKCHISLNSWPILIISVLHWVHGLYCSSFWEPLSAYCMCFTTQLKPFCFHSFLILHFSNVSVWYMAFPSFFRIFYLLQSFRIFYLLQSSNIPGTWSPSYLMSRICLHASVGNSRKVYRPFPCSIWSHLVECRWPWQMDEISPR